MSTRFADSHKLDAALEQLDRFLGTAAQRGGVPFFGPTQLSSMTELDQARAAQAERAAYEAAPEETAIHFCITAAIALVEVSQALLARPAEATPAQREMQWKTLHTYTKTAGRSAYRAASILADRKSAPV
ncbi:MAG: hypothetical protein JSR41_11505 [Proteobacteria bacterium]|nr:hypothetical protein [Pseudomonadota bacterium]